MNYHELFRKVENQLSEIENQESLRETLGLIIERILKDFSEDFGFSGARLYGYDLDEQGYRLEAKFGSGTSVPIGYLIPQTYPPIQVVRRKGFIYMGLDSEGVDPALEERLGVQHFAALTVGPNHAYLIAFTVQRERLENRDDVLFALSTLRHAINLKLAKEQLEGLILQSREIQLSLLPDEAPKFPGFDIFGRSVPAELVGGDVYDFIRINPNILGVAIGDATGHGLPAALQARDVVMGLRMGLSEDQKTVKVFEKLNRVINASRLTSRYVSLFYGELEQGGGHFIYCNAGHNPPFYYRVKKDRFYPMTEGGRVLGPTSDSTYRRGFFKLDPGDSIIMFTDGISEATDASGKEFGEDGVKAFVRDNYDRFDARQMVCGLLDLVTTYSVGSKYTDDRTAVYIRRLE